MIENKRRIGRDSSTKEIYNQFKDKTSDGSLKNKSLTELFTLALAMGLKFERKPLNEKNEFIRAESFGKTLPTLMKSLAIYEEKDIEVLADDEKIYTISEEYANAGIKYLSSKYSKDPNIFTEFLLREIITKIDSEDLLTKIDKVLEN